MNDSDYQTEVRPSALVIGQRKLRVCINRPLSYEVMKEYRVKAISSQFLNAASTSAQLNKTFLKHEQIKGGNNLYCCEVLSFP